MKLERTLSPLLAAVALMLASTGVAQAASVYSENFDAYTNGNVAGQDGWSAVTNSAKIQVGDSGGLDKVIAGDSAPSGLGQTGVAKNTGLFSFSASSVIFEGRMRTRYKNSTTISVLDGSGDAIFTFGVGDTSKLGFVVLADDGSTLHNANLAGENALSGTSGVDGTFQWFAFRFTVALNGISDATGTFAVDKDGGAVAFQTVASGLDLGLTVAHEDTTTWDGLQLTMRFNSVQFDDLNVDATLLPPQIPTPAALPAGLALLGLVAARRSRRIA